MPIDRTIMPVNQSTMQGEAESRQERTEAADELWSIWRQDDNGQKYEVARGLTLEAAKLRVAELESHGHKQTYWVEQTNRL